MFFCTYTFVGPLSVGILIWIICCSLDIPSRNWLACSLILTPCFQLKNKHPDASIHLLWARRAIDLKLPVRSMSIDFARSLSRTGLSSATMKTALLADSNRRIRLVSLLNSKFKTNKLPWRAVDSGSNPCFFGTMFLFLMYELFQYRLLSLGKPSKIWSGYLRTKDNRILWGQIDILPRHCND